MATEEIVKPESSARVHHPTSPSKLQMLEYCPCYESYDVVHEMTERGSKQHDVVESGQVHDETMSDEDALMAMERHQWIRERINQLLSEYPGNLKMLTEEYYPIDDKPVWTHKEHQKFFGTTAGYLDCALIFNDRKRAEIHDWKFGNWAVTPAYDNLQGMAYALGVCKVFPSIETVGVFFHLPRIQDKPDEHWFTRQELEQKCRQRIEVVVSRALNAKQTGRFDMAKSGYPVCAFCSRIADCPRVAEKIQLVGTKYGELTVPCDINPLQAMSEGDTNAAMRLAHVVSAWAYAYKTRVCDRVLEGKAECPSDYTLVKQQPREIGDQKAFEQVVRRFISLKQYRDECLKPSLGAVEKAIRAKTQRGQKDAMIENFSRALEETEGAIQLGERSVFLRAKRTSSKS